MKGAPNLTPDQIETLSLQDAWAIGHAAQVQWVKENLTQDEIDRLAVAGVDCFVERCEAAAKATAA